jgi:DNA-binding NarL/FixJ family response regulator
MVLKTSFGDDQPMTMTLLIVDDSDLIRTSLRGLLDGIRGIDAIHMADTLVQTLAMVRRVGPTLLILDLHLPDGNAMTVIPYLKQLASEMNIAVLTNDATELNRKKSLQAGADWVFDKSTEFENLLEIVQMQAALNILTTPNEGSSL